MASKGPSHRRRIPETAPAGRAAAAGRPADDGLAGPPAASAPRSCGDDEAVQALLNASQEQAMLLAPDGTILACNEAAARAFGRSAAETVGAGLPDLVGPELRAHRKALLDEVVRTGRPIRHEDQRDGRILLSSVHPVFGADGRVARVAVFCSDITARKRAEGELRDHGRRLRALMAELALTEERERKRIAADLHDTVGHSIALARMKLEAIRWSASADEVSQLLAEAGRLIEQAGADIGAAIHDLRPPALYEKGLEAALAAMVEDLCRQAPHVRFAFIPDGQPKPLSEDARIVLFRAARELLVNVVRHARARTARVSLGRNGPHVRLEVADDGVGLDAAAGPGPEGSKGGLGLLSIRERVEYLGGSVRADSAPNQGTRVVLELPVVAERPPAPGQRPRAV